MPIATRLTNAGTLLVNGSFDENTSISPAKFRTTSTAVYAAELDEVSFVPGRWTLAGSQGVTVGNSSAFALPGDFTVEFFFYLASVPAGEIDFWESQTTSSFRILKRGSSSGLSYDAYGGTSYLIVADASIPVNAWNHVAVSRTGTTVQAYFNGTRTINQTDATSFAAPTANYGVGCRATGANSLTGSISNFRLITGAGMYTGATIPVPTAPLGAVSGTQLLLTTPNTGGAFFDYSTNNFTVTKVSTPTSASSSPFTVNTPQRQTSTGVLQVKDNFDEVSLAAGAIAFNGTSQYLTIANNAAFDLATGTPDWTIECWFKTSLASSQQILVQKDGVSGSRQSQYDLMINASNQIQGVLSPAASSTGNQNFISSVTVTTNTWYHVAMVRSGSNITIFLNGVIVVGPTALTITMGNNTGPLSIGANGAGASYLNGYISNVRIVKGTAVYTAAFTPPQSILPSIANTQVLLNVTDSANFIKDNSPNNFTVTNNGTATWNASGPFNT